MSLIAALYFTLHHEGKAGSIFKGESLHQLVGNPDRWSCLHVSFSGRPLCKDSLRLKWGTWSSFRNVWFPADSLEIMWESSEAVRAAQFGFSVSSLGIGRSVLAVNSPDAYLIALLVCVCISWYGHELAQSIYAKWMWQPMFFSLSMATTHATMN